MARIRTIKPEFFTSEDIVSMTPLARLFYVSLWCEADRKGRLEWRPGTLKMRYFPGDSCDINELADELVSRGLIVLYKADGKIYAEIPTFGEHQVINNRESESVIPEKTIDACVTRESGEKAEGKEGRERKGTGKEGNGRERKEGSSDGASPATGPAWRAYSQAYQTRYHAEPVRNATTNAQMANFVRRIGAGEAPGVAMAYLASNNRFYVESGHSVGLLLRDGEKLRTEWATGRRTTATQAMLADRTQSNGDVFKKLISEAENVG
ncbi:MAG: hypothetical protein KGL39_16850 [Patescibacteria group bacterium]|nr:hypothetical protein [Patescibacteria group bacterium]